MFLIVAVTAAVGLTSCKKDYNCTCVIAGQTTVSEFKDVKKSDAEEACNALSAAASIAGGSCALN